MRVAHAVYSADINSATNLPFDLTAKFDKDKPCRGKMPPSVRIVKLMRYVSNMSQPSVAFTKIVFWKNNTKFIKKKRQSAKKRQ
jgi:hypothetical protein